jgi:hypothetical protein
MELRIMDKILITAVMPIPRFEIDSAFNIDEFSFFPRGEFDIAKLNPVPPIHWVQLLQKGEEIPAGTQLRWSPLSLTGFGSEVLNTHTLVVFDHQLSWNEFCSFRHSDDVNLLRLLSGHAEKAMDIVRFHNCTFDLPDALPGQVGTWFNSGDYMGALLYNYQLGVGFLLSGSGVECSAIVKGVGLKIEEYPYWSLPLSSGGEVGRLCSHALNLFSDVMNSSNETTKYIRAMSLLEFLASPDKYAPWKKLKGNIICHTAKSITDYQILSERFKRLTSCIDDTGKQIGLRTLIVHHGKLLPEIMTRKADRDELFLELQEYAAKALIAMYLFSSKSWNEFQSYRDKLKSKFCA